MKEEILPTRGKELEHVVKKLIEYELAKKEIEKEKEEKEFNQKQEDEFAKKEGTAS